MPRSRDAFGVGKIGLAVADDSIGKENRLVGAAAIAVWMLVLLPIGLIAAGYIASLGLDFAFAKINKPPADDNDPSEEDAGS